MALPPTPWLRPPDTDQNYLKGYGLGQQGASEQVQIAMAQQRMAQQAAEASAQLQERSQAAQMEIEMRQKEHERQSLMDQQKLEIEKSYRQSQIGLEKQKLDEEIKINQSKLSQTANLAAAQMEAQKRIAAGEDPSDVWMEIGPRAGMTGAGMGSLIRSKQAMLPPEDVQAANVLSPEGAKLPGVFAYRGSSGKMDVRNAQGFQGLGSISEANSFWARKYEKDLEELNKTWNRRGFTDEPPENKTPEDKVKYARWKSLKDQRDALVERISGLVPEPDMIPSAPASAEGWQTIGGFKVRVKK
jgi:hypothetical protein